MGAAKVSREKAVLWLICYYVNTWATFYYIFGREITQDNVEQWKKTLFEEAKSAILTACCLNLFPTRRSLIMSGFTA